ncbi:MAG: YlbF family regulator [Clostridia bacterium]|nr:YlbF family regulator [Clostridia bacterium]
MEDTQKIHPVIQAAIRFTHAVQESEEYRRYRESEKKTLESMECVMAVDRYMELRSRAAGGDMTGATLQKLQDAKDHLDHLPLMREMEEAKAAFQSLMDQAESILRFGIYGDSGDNEGCPGSCASCPGCGKK